MKMLMVAATAVVLGACPAFAQSYTEPSQSGPWSDDRTNPSLRAQPPGGAYQGYFETRDRPPEQTAEVPSGPTQRKRPHPGTLTKFNSNSGYGPEVEFDVERREAEQQKMQERQQAPR